MADSLQLDIVTPEKAVYSGVVSEVGLPGTLGEIGVLPGHRPLLTLLAGGTTVATETTEDGVVLKLPGGAPDMVSSTVKLVISGKPEIGEVAVLPAKNGTIHLDSEAVRLHGQQLRIESADKASNIGYWNNPSESVSWTMKVRKPGKPEVRFT